MRYANAVALAALLICSCDNLFHHEIDPVDPSPVVESVEPKDNADNVFLNTAIIIRFSSKMDLTTITEKEIIVERIDENEEKTITKTPIIGKVEAFNNKKMCTTTFSLEGGVYFDVDKKYTVTIKRGLRATSGKILEDDYVSEFTTGGEKDDDPPVLVSVSPGYLMNKENSFNNFDVGVCFSEPLLPSSISGLNIILEDLKSSSNFKYKIIKVDDFTQLSQNCIIVTPDFKPPLVPKGKYRVMLINSDRIKDLASNNYQENTIQGLIRHVRVYDYPDQSPCWKPVEGSECSK